MHDLGQRGCRIDQVTFRSDLGQSAVDGQVDAGNEAGVVTGQKQRNLGDVGGSAKRKTFSADSSLIMAKSAPAALGPVLRDRAHRSARAEGGWRVCLKSCQSRSGSKG